MSILYSLLYRFGLSLLLILLFILLFRPSNHNIKQVKKITKQIENINQTIIQHYAEDSKKKIKKIKNNPVNNQDIPTQKDVDDLNEIWKND